MDKIPEPIDTIEGDKISVGDESGSSSAVVFGKNIYKFTIWNTELKRDDSFEYQETVLPNDQPQQTYQRARMKAMSFVNSRSAYAGQKLRNPGEPR